MGGVRDWLELCRVSNLPTVWTNVLAASVLAAGPSLPRETVFPLLSLSLLYAAGMALNDFCDAGEDARLRPDRPIPSGRISRAGAGGLAALLVAAAIVTLLCAPFPESAAAGALLGAVVVSYDVLHSRTRLSVILMASCRFGCYAVTAVALTGELAPAPAAGGAVQFLYVLLLTAVARREKSRPFPGRSRVPAMLSGIPLVDGAVGVAGGTLALIPVAAAASLATVLGQKTFRGD